MLDNIKNNLHKRIIVGIVGGVFFLSMILINKWTYFIMFLSINVIILNELFKIISLDPKFKFLGYLISIVSFSISYLHCINLVSLKFVISLSFLPYLIFKLGLLQHPMKDSFANIAFGIISIFYVSIPFVLFNYITFLKGSYNSNLILSIFFIIWTNDTGAYFIGKFFGKHKLTKYISPKKTWEGTIGGFICSILMSFLLFKLNLLSIGHWYVFAIILSTIGTLGDLVASLLKRNYNVKDSGNLLPGHGGFLDRFDSFIFSIPFIFAYLYATT